MTHFHFLTLRGAGFESTSSYPNTELTFLNIANIHVMRDSLRKLQNVCYPDVDNAHYLAHLESSHWLEHVKLVRLEYSSV